LAEGRADRDLGVFIHHDFQQYAFGGGFEFVADFFSLELDHRLADFDGVALALKPADNIGFGSRDAAGLRNFERGDDVDLRVYRVI